MAHAENFESNKNFNLRRQGIFFFLGGLVFLFKSLLDLNELITWLLFLAVEFIYLSVLPEKDSGRRQLSLTKKFFRFLAQFILMLIVVFIVMGALAWLWRMTGILPAFPTAIILISVGFVLLGWSYLRVPNR